MTTLALATSEGRSLWVSACASVRSTPRVATPNVPIRDSGRRVMRWYQYVASEMMRRRRCLDSYAGLP